MQPTRVIAVDWSGAKAGEQKKIWLAEIALRDSRNEVASGKNELSQEFSAACGELVRLCDGWTREAVTSELVRAVRDADVHGERLVIGLDFSFGFPSWYAQRNGWSSGRDVWNAWTADRVEQTLTAPQFPFWGRGAQRAKPVELSDESDTPPLRLTEMENDRVGPRPFSVFQLVGAGAVGVGSLRGMATLRALSDAGAEVWPFGEKQLQTAEKLQTAEGAETRREAGGEERATDEVRRSLVVEIWPRLYAPAVNKSNAEERLGFLRSRRAWQSLARPALLEDVEAAIARSDDAFDALMGALALWSARAELAELPRINDAAERIEGRIWRPERALQ